MGSGQILYFMSLKNWRALDKGKGSGSPLVSRIRNYLILLEMESKSDQKDSCGVCVSVRACMSVYVSM